MRTAEGLREIKLSGKSVDDALVLHVMKNGGIVATLDVQLKKRIKENGGSILSVANDKIILEPSKT